MLHRFYRKQYNPVTQVTRWNSYELCDCPIGHNHNET